MPLITETYYLSLTQDNRGILRLRCSQNDTLRTANLKLYNNGSTFTIPSGISAYVSGVKQNGAVFSKSCTISQDRKSVVLQLSSDITNVDGVIIAEIVLNDGNGDRLGTSNFIIQVEKNPTRVGVIQDTETPIEYVNDFITQIQALTARVNNLITPNGDPSLAEVVDARISSLDGNTYQNLKARIDADVATLNTRKANKSEVYTKSQVDDLLENVEIDVDDELSDVSENPVQNKVVAGAISTIQADLEEKRWSDDAKQALLDCLDKVAWKDESGPVYRETLEALLYGRAPSTIEKIWANGVGLSISGTQEMSVITNTKRGIIYNKSGEVPLVSTAQTEGAVYPIPIPAGATGVKFHGMQETDYITLNMQILKYENGKWLQVAAAGFSKIVPDVLCRTELTYRNDGTYYMVGTYGLADATHTNPQESRGNVTIDTSGFEMEVITEPEKFFTNGLGLTVSSSVPTVSANTKRGLLYQKDGTTPLLSSVQGVNNVYPIHIPQGATGVKFHGMKTSDYISISLQIMKYENGSWIIKNSTGFAKIVPDTLSRTEIASYNNGDYYMIGTYGISDATHTSPLDGTVTIDTSDFTMEVVAE